MKSFKEFIIEGSKGARRLRRRMESAAKRAERETKNAITSMMVRTASPNTAVKAAATEVATERMNAAADALEVLSGLRSDYSPVVQRSIDMMDTEKRIPSMPEYFEKLALKKLAHWATMKKRPVAPEYRFTPQEGAARNLQAHVATDERVSDLLNRAKSNRNLAMELFRRSGGKD